MKRGILCILLSLLLLVPMFASCQQEADLSGTEASIYTFYTIVDEQTSEEAIHQVELALNRIMFYRLGVILKLEMVTEDEYDKLIEDKFAEVEAYQEEKKNSNKKEDSSASSEEVEETSVDLMTGDRILDLLEDGEEIPLDEPRLDIFLVRGYDKYYELASNNKLAALDEKLNNEAKQLKSSIHSTLFTAALVDKKTYGVPVNNAIGEYTYLVFDKEILDKHNIDPNTLKSVEDLQDYLELVKTNDPDVVPLKNAMAPTNINFLSSEGFPAIINSSGEVVDTYSNKAFKNYYSMIARYQALGYLSDSVATAEEAADDTRYAVRIESGNIDSIEARLKDTGYEYEYSLYSNPLATNETTIDNIFCVSKFAASSELGDIMEILTAINTDSQLMNLLTYGVENENYILNDDKQVERLPESPSIINPNYVGNCFITYTLAGENPEKWNNDIKQNQDAIVSPSLGFTSSREKFKYKVTTEVEDPKNPGEFIEQTEEFEIFEPDYVEIFRNVADKYYPALLSGTAVEFDYDALLTEATDTIVTEYTERLNDLYEENELKPMFAQRMRDSITKNKGPEILKAVTKDVMEDYNDSVRTKLTNVLKAQYKEEYPDASDDDIADMIEETLTDDYIAEHFSDYYSDEEVQEYIDELYIEELEYEIEVAIDDIIDTPEYDREFAKLLNSEEYKNDLNAMLSYDAPRKIQAKVDELISEKLAVYTDAIIEELNLEVETAVNNFIEENSEILGLTREQMLETMGYLKVVEKEETEEGAEEDTEEDTEGEEGEDTEETVEYEQPYETWYEFAFKVKLYDVYKELYPNTAA